ncbi:MAG: rod shape-determining protein MreD [Oscillospiraceae bacterium]|nr:rod shape-determining protein MreD [Oscillospiraceae bacterium]
MPIRNWMIKWSVYSLALLLVYFLQTLVTDRILIFGVRPDLIPVAIAAVAVLEGGVGGAGFGLGAGLFSLAVFHSAGILALLIYPLAGALVGLLAEYVLQNTFLSCALCVLIFFTVLELWRILPPLIGGAAFLPLLGIALPEFLYSLLFTLPVYALFRSVYKRVGGFWL